ncbi:MAG: hypothetical protein AAFU85_02185 [Planctomycetota bacterium]
MARRKIGRAIGAALSIALLVSIVGAGAPTELTNETRDSLKKIGITPQPSVCQGCAAEEAALLVASIDLAAAYDAYSDAQQALIECEMEQGGGPSPSHPTDSGESILVKN